MGVEEPAYYQTPNREERGNNKWEMLLSYHRFCSFSSPFSWCFCHWGCIKAPRVYETIPGHSDMCHQQDNLPAWMWTPSDRPLCALNTTLYSFPAWSKKTRHWCKIMTVYCREDAGERGVCVCVWPNRKKNIKDFEKKSSRGHKGRAGRGRGRKLSDATKRSSSRVLRES